MLFLDFVPDKGTLRISILMNDVNNQLANYLRTLRGEKSLYQVEKEMGFSRSLLRRYEVGERTPEDSTLKRLAQYYGVEYSDLKFRQFDDLYPAHSENKALIQRWIASQSD